MISDESRVFTMDVEQALVLVDRLLEGQKLRDVQAQVFRYAWSGWTYPEIAEQIGYDTGHTRDVGSKLWQQISQAVGEQVNKKNVQTVLHRQLLQKADGHESSTLIFQPESREPARSSVALSDVKTDHGMRLDEPQLALTSSPLRQHWGEAIDVSVFHGRTSELTLLKQWLLQDGCRLVTVLGMGGMGKTTLVTKLAHLLQDEFDLLIWQSLRNAPAIADVLAHVMQLLPGQHTTPLPMSLESQITSVMAGLRACRCLLIWDNFDAVLSSHSAGLPANSQGVGLPANSQAHSQAGQYREGYEAYGELLRRIGVEHHASHVLLTSREQPNLLAMLEGETLPIRTLRLTGLEATAIQAICQTNGCLARSHQDWSILANQYAGNPLAIKIVSSVVRDLFEGQLTPFLQQGAIAFGDIRTLLDEQLQRLSELERHIIYWLAIGREWVSLNQLRSALMPSPSQTALLEALISLWQRSLIERRDGRFTLQPVVMEYVTEQLLDRVFAEITTWEIEHHETLLRSHPPTLPLLCTHALIQARTEDYLRESQIRVLLAPLAIRLENYFQSINNLECHLQGVLSSLRRHSLAIGYMGGNLINLLHELGISLNGYDFSHLAIWQACLQGVDLHQTDFTGSQFSESVFTETLAIPLAIAFSPSGDCLASGDLNSAVRLWRVADGETVLIGKGHSGWVWSIAFSPDGKRLASGSEDHTVKLWDVETGACLKTLEGHPSPIWCVAFSPDGRLLASSSEDWTVKLWNVQTGHCLTTLKGHQNWVRSVAFSPLSRNPDKQDRSLLASAGDDHTIKLWNLKTGKCERTLNGHHDRVWSIAFSPNGRWLASGSSDQSIRLWDVQTGDCLKIMEGHESWVRSIAFSADGRTVISGSEDRTVRFWDWQTGTCRQILSGHTSWVRSVAAHPNTSLVASGSGDHTIKLWDSESGRCCRTLTGCTNRVWSIAALSNLTATDSRLVSSHDDHCVRLWNLSTGECEQTLRGHTNAVCTICFANPQENAVSPTPSAIPAKGTVEGLIASGSADCTIKLWNGQGQCLATLREHLSRIWSVAFSPDGEWLASSSDDQTVKLWQVATRRCHQTLQGHTSWVCSVAFSPVPSVRTALLLASGGYDQTVKLWDGMTGACLQTLEGHTNWVWTVAFSPDGQTLASGSGDHTIKLWNVETGTCIQTLQGHSSRIWSIVFSPDGQWLASASTDQTVRLWDVKTGNCLQILRGHTNVVTAVAFTSDGYLTSSSQDETIKLWDLATGQCLNTLKADRPYEGMDITEIKGLTDTQKATLRALGALEH